MNGQERRNKIIQLLTDAKTPIAGKELSVMFDVSRQVIVQDIALLRAQKYEIISTNRGYILEQYKKEKRVFKVKHSDDQTRNELQTIIDFGGSIEDVFVYHRVYGVIRAELNIETKEDIDEFFNGVQSGKSSLLKNVTSGYHYHTVSAPTKVILDLIQNQLQEKGFLVSLQDYEPVDFWKEEKKES